MDWERIIDAANGRPQSLAWIVDRSDADVAAPATLLLPEEAPPVHASPARHGAPMRNGSPAPSAVQDGRIVARPSRRPARRRRCRLLHGVARRRRPRTGLDGSRCEAAREGGSGGVRHMRRRPPGRAHRRRRLARARPGGAGAEITIVVRDPHAIAATAPAWTSMTDGERARLTMAAAESGDAAPALRLLNDLGRAGCAMLSARRDALDAPTMAEDAVRVLAWRAPTANGTPGRSRRVAPS